MKCQSLFFGKNKKKTFNLSSAEFAQRMVKVKIHCKNIVPDTRSIQIPYFSYFFKKT